MYRAKKEKLLSMNRVAPKRSSIETEMDTVVQAAIKNA